MGSKTLCDWSKKDINRNSKKLSGIISDPKYFCKDCARASNKEKYLCKPEKISK